MKKILALLLVLFLVTPLAAFAQGGRKLILRFRAEGTMQALGIYGPAGVTVKAEGQAFLDPEAQGKFTGKGDISVTMDFHYPKSGVVSISQLRGEGTLDVVGQAEGQFLRFYFKHGSIPCKGEIVVNYPAPMGTQKEPYEDQFDPNVVAPGEQPGVKIELRDGAGEEISFGPESYAGGKQIASWTSEFALHNVEQWNVVVKGEETDSTQPPIKNPKLKTKNKELPVAVKFEWELTGRFYIIGDARQYYDGEVGHSVVTSGFVFEHDDLYRWSEIAGTDDLPTESQINGKVSGNTVQLKWPKYTPHSVIAMAPKLSYLEPDRQRRSFKSGEFINYISREKLPLVDGQVTTGGASDWLKYKITLTRIK